MTPTPPPQDRKPRPTSIFVTTITLVVIAWDILAYHMQAKWWPYWASISQTILGWSSAFPGAPILWGLAFGTLTGHCLVPKGSPATLFATVNLGVAMGLFVGHTWLGQTR